MKGSDDSGPTRKLSTVAALIGKAQSTTFPAEQESLAMGAYSQLAAYLNSLDRPEHDGGARRERRLLADRRDRPPLGDRPSLPEAAGLPEAVRPPEPAPEVIDLRTDRLRSLYREPGRRAPGARVDLTL